MPAIKCAKATREKLCQLISPSIVSVNTYDKSNYKFDFATGFIIYSERGKTLVCVHKSVVKGTTPLYVHFNNGDIEKAEIFLNKTTSGHVVLKTGGRARPAVSFSQSAAKREEVFTIAEIQGGYLGFNFMTGTISCPSCKAINKNSVVIPESTQTFAMTCAAIKWPHQGKIKDELIGAAVFELVHGTVIGTIISLDKDVYDLKFASQSYCWVDKLETLLGAKDKMVKLKKVNLDELSKVKKRKRTEDNSMVGQLQLEQARQVM